MSAQGSGSFCTPLFLMQKGDVSGDRATVFSFPSTQCLCGENIVGRAYSEFPLLTASSAWFAGF